MSAGIDYSETRPPQRLQSHVACVWRLQCRPSPGRVDTIYPDGHVELIVHLACPPMVLETDGRWQQQSRCLFAAQTLAPVQLRPVGPIDCVGIRLKPAASYSPGGDCGKLLDRVVPLADVNSQLASALHEVITANRASPASPALWAVLTDQLLRRPVEPEIERAVAAIMDSGGDIRIHSLANVAAMSIRSLQQRFLVTVGLSPKQFCRIVRLQVTLRMLDGAEQPLAQLAHEAGYFDQAHASRETTSMLGLTPSALRSALESDRSESRTLRMAASFIRGQSGDRSNSIQT